MQVGDDVVIIGTGSIGVYCLMVAKAAGAGRLVAVDLSDYSLSTAKRLGATHTINPKQVDAKQAIYDIMPDGPDLVVEAAGPRYPLERIWYYHTRRVQVRWWSDTLS